MNNHSSNPSEGLLAGIKVLDLSRIMAGPWATQLLADYGATVWKIEKPKVGDDTRQWGPPYLQSDNEKISAYFLSANRGKKSVCIDISQPHGQQLIKQLALKADVVVENFKVGKLKQYGLDYASLAALKPSLIYCSISGFGQTGPMAAAPGYDAMIQATGGLMSITGSTDETGGEPQKVGVAVTDLMTGMYAATAILAALNYRNSCGKGQHLDVALLDTQIAMLANQGLNYLVSDEVPQRMGNAHPNIVPYQTFRCADAHLMLAVGNDLQFNALCEQLECAELAEDPQYSSNAQRVNHRSQLIPMLEKRFIVQSRDHWLEKFARANIPCGPVNNIQQAFADPQVQHRQMVFNKQSKRFGEIPQVASPVKFSQVDGCSSIAPPSLGQDTDKILSDELSISHAELQQLKSQDVV